MTAPLTRTPELDRREHTQPVDTAERRDANWEAIAARLDAAPKPARRWVAPTVVIAAAAAAVLGLLLRPAEVPSWAGTTLTAGAESARARLEDGSEVVAAPGAELERRPGAEDELRLALRRGSATFEVARDPSRTFIVEVEDVEVRVVGTRFVVRRQPGAVAVEVERGAVDVRLGEEVRRLRPGQRWSGPSEAAAPAPAAEPVQWPEAEEASERPPRRRRRGARPSAEELFEAARSARREGDARAAEQAYERFLRAHGRNPRAGPAALELGRLRMDSLGDPAGAAEAFERALRVGPGSFREDAMARLVRARDRAGQRAACQRALDAYLARYPEGRHADDLTCR